MIDLIGGEKMTQAAAISPAAEARINTFLARVYLLMFVGLAITGVVSYWVSENLRFQYRLFTNSWLGWGLLILQVIVVVALSANVMRMRAMVVAKRHPKRKHS
jgi:FtsH-binding integral membrane protein